MDKYRQKLIDRITSGKVTVGFMSLQMDFLYSKNSDFSPEEIQSIEDTIDMVTGRNQTYKELWGRLKRQDSVNVLLLD